MNSHTNHTNSLIQIAKAAIYRQLLLGVGEQCFANTGFDHTPMQKIAESAGISLKTLYNYFKSKQALYQYIRDVRGDALLKTVENDLLHNRDISEHPIRFLLQVIESPLRFFLDHPNYVKMQLHSGNIWFDSHAREGNEELWHRGRCIIEHAYSVGCDAKVLSPMNIDIFFMQLISILQTMLSYWISLDQRLESRESLVTQAKCFFIRTFFVPSISQMMLSSDGSQVREPFPPWENIAQSINSGDLP